MKKSRPSDVPSWRQPQTTTTMASLRSLRQPPPSLNPLANQPSPWYSAASHYPQPPPDMTRREAPPMDHYRYGAQPTQQAPAPQGPQQPQQAQHHAGPPVQQSMSHGPPPSAPGTQQQTPTQASAPSPAPRQRKRPAPGSQPQQAHAQQHAQQHVQQHVQQHAQHAHPHAAQQQAHSHHMQHGHPQQQLQQAPPPPQHAQQAPMPHHSQHMPQHAQQQGAPSAQPQAQTQTPVMPPAMPPTPKQGPAASPAPAAAQPPPPTPQVQAAAPVDDGSPGSNPPRAKKSRTNTPWTPAEELRLKQMRDLGNSWAEIAKTFPNRTEGSVKKHWYKDMHYAEFAEDESQALMNAIKEYENNKWKSIGNKVGKPAKACEQYAKEHFPELFATPKRS